MGQTIHLSTKDQASIQKHFSRESILQGRLENSLEFVGAKTVRVFIINTVPLNDYNRTAGSDRYGAPQEIGDTVQELTMTQDKAFSGYIDKGNSLDQVINKAGEFLSNELNQIVIPEKDKYGFSVLAKKAGKTVSSTADITAANVGARMKAARSWFVNRRVPRKGCTWYMRTGVYDALTSCEEFRGLESLMGRALIRGQVGELFGSPVVEVPEDLMPAGVNFIYIHKSAAASPSKIADTKTHIDPPGISGHRIEGRFYWDTFVFGAKSDGVYADITAKDGVSVLSAPQINAASGAITGVSSGAVVMYTTDGSDPRYSADAKTGTAPAAAAGAVVKAYQYHPSDPKVFPSEVKSVELTGA